jgi:hypothetical protein
MFINAVTPLTRFWETLSYRKVVDKNRRCISVLYRDVIPVLIIDKGAEGGEFAANPIVGGALLSQAVY